MVIACVRCPRCDELKHDRPDAPKIGLRVVLVISQDFRSHVEWRPAESLGQVLLLHVAREPEVPYLQLPVRVMVGEEKILRLEVAMDEVALA